MREIKKNIEQLEEAAQQLSKQTPTGARLSLLLLDNLAELLMYRKVCGIFAMRSGSVIAPKYSFAKQQQVKGCTPEKRA